VEQKTVYLGLLPQAILTNFLQKSICLTAPEFLDPSSSSLLHACYNNTYCLFIEPLSTASKLTVPSKMAAPLTTNPESDNFRFQDLQPMGSHTALIYIPGLNADPANSIAAQNAWTMVDIYTNNNQVQYLVEVDAGRIGNPAVNNGIRLQASPLLPAVSVTISIEPGQAFERRSGPEDITPRDRQQNSLASKVVAVLCTTTTRDPSRRYARHLGTLL
jgi:hypothetical protein